MHASCSVHCTCSSLIFVLNSLFHIFQFLLISPSKCSRSTSLYRTKRCTTLLNSSNRSILTSIFFKFWQRGVPFNFCFFGVFFLFFFVLPEISFHANMVPFQQHFDSFESSFFYTHKFQGNWMKGSFSLTISGKAICY